MSTDDAMHVSWLADALDAITRYTHATQRLGMHDLSLLDTLRDREAAGALNCTAAEAMLRFIEHRETVFIGGGRGTDVWTFFDDDADEVIARLGLVYVCERHGGPWGDDETCPRCTFTDGQVRPHSDPGPLGEGAES